MSKFLCVWLPSQHSPRQRLGVHSVYKWSKSQPLCPPAARTDLRTWLSPRASRNKITYFHINWINTNVQVKPEASVLVNECLNILFMWCSYSPMTTTILGFGPNRSTVVFQIPVCSQIYCIFNCNVSIYIYIQQSNCPHTFTAVVEFGSCSHTAKAQNVFKLTALVFVLTL